MLEGGYIRRDRHWRYFIVPPPTSRAGQEPADAKPRNGSYKSVQAPGTERHVRRISWPICRNNTPPLSMGKGIQAAMASLSFTSQSASLPSSATPSAGALDGELLVVILGPPCVGTMLKRLEDRLPLRGYVQCPSWFVPCRAVELPTKSGSVQCGAGFVPTRSGFRPPKR